MKRCLALPGAVVLGAVVQRAVELSAVVLGAVVLGAAVLLAAGGCTGAHPAPAATTPAATTPAVASTARGCGQTPVRTDGLPAWTASAGSLPGMPYVISTDGNLVGALFGMPLHVRPVPDGHSNKILWIVRLPRNGESLLLTGHLLGGHAPDVHATEPADSSPGEIYPSIVDVPVAGCWHFTAVWSGHTSTVDLYYTP
jgi:hypothetical protein